MAGGWHGRGSAPAVELAEGFWPSVYQKSTRRDPSPSRARQHPRLAVAARAFSTEEENVHGVYLYAITSPYYGFGTHS